jgi:ADP-ribose pyrophosphatase YjhB (NUDIX family)
MREPDLCLCIVPKSNSNHRPFSSFQGDQFLLCRRKRESFEGGKWCLPCGYIEFDEDYLTAARREVKEETGLEIEITALLSVASNFLRPEIHTLAVAVLAKPVGGAICPGDDVDELGWFSPGDKLPNFAFSADRHMVERYFATRPPGRARRSRLRPAGVNGTQLAFAERRAQDSRDRRRNVLLRGQMRKISACPDLSFLPPDDLHQARAVWKLDAGRKNDNAVVENELICPAGRPRRSI